MCAAAVEYLEMFVCISRMLVSHDFKGLATSFYKTSFILLGRKKKRKEKKKTEKKLTVTVKKREESCCFKKFVFVELCKADDVRELSNCEQKTQKGQWHLF